MSDACGILFEHVLHKDHQGCILPRGHDGKHLSVVDKERERKYIAWETDLECGCEEDDCDCTVFEIVSEKEAAKIMTDFSK
jgi:hypothetical protein